MKEVEEWSRGACTAPPCTSIIMPMNNQKLNEAYKHVLREKGCNDNLRPVILSGWYEDYIEEEDNEPNPCPR
jgi:hypothetical protein